MKSKLLLFPLLSCYSEEICFLCAVVHELKAEMHHVKKK